MDMAVIGGMLFGMVIAVIIGLLFAGLVMKFSVRLVEGFSPGYGRSILTVLAAAVLAFIVNLGLTMAFGVGSGLAAMDQGGDPAATQAAMAAMGGSMLLVMGLSLLASFLLNAACINWIIRHPDGRAIGFARSLLVALLYLVVMVVLSIIVSLVLGMIVGLGAAGLAGAAG